MIHVSVDGLRPDAITRHDASTLPAFYRLRTEGAFTDNARTDEDYRVTLPNHASQLTGRHVLGQHGHGWTQNGTPAPGETLHTNQGHYIASVFDVVHDHGMETALYASKSKFVLFDQSYDSVHGAPDLIGPDDGRDKIDTFVYDADTEALVSRFVADATAEPYRYAFVHLRDPDTAGHQYGWDLDLQSPYMAAVRTADQLLGRLLDLAASDPRLANRTTIIVTTDHGGSGTHHQADRPEHYTIPFYVWGLGVSYGDLYEFNSGGVEEPADWLPHMSAQPIRNGTAANLALALLGLGPVPGSTIDAVTTSP